MPFPLGILELESKPRGAIAWAWSMSGLFTTMGAVLSALLSLWVGFRTGLRNAHQGRLTADQLAIGLAWPHNARLTV